MTEIQIKPIEWIGTSARGIGSLAGIELFTVTRVGGAKPYRISTRLLLPEADRVPWECRSPEEARERAAAMLARFVELVRE